MEVRRRPRRDESSLSLSCCCLDVRRDLATFCKNTNKLGRRRDFPMLSSGLGKGNLVNGLAHEEELTVHALVPYMCAGHLPHA